MSNLQGKKILIIDDEPELLVILEYTFSKAGAHLLTADNGHEGLRQFYAHQPDLAVVDLMMPGMSGWEV